eukprot:6208531-Pleurochrysis_carterae.AAC.5
MRMCDRGVSAPSGMLKQQERRHASKKKSDKYQHLAAGACAHVFSFHSVLMSEAVSQSKPPPHPAMVPQRMAATAEPLGARCAAPMVFSMPHVVIATPQVKSSSMRRTVATAGDLENTRYTMSLGEW